MKQNKPLLSLIVAMAHNNVIGHNNSMPWGRLPSDLAYFKEKTSGNPIIMGRKTFDSIGKILPGRTNIVISSNKNLSIEGAFVTNSIEEAIEIAQLESPTEIFFIGGRKIYEKVLSFIDKLYITEINADFEGDTFFPNYDNLNLSLLETHHIKKDNINPYSCTFKEFQTLS